MSCEQAKAIAHEAMQEWVEVEQEMLVQRTPMLGKVNVVTPEQVRAIEDVNQRYSAAANKAVEAMKVWLSASEFHRDPRIEPR